MRFWDRLKNHFATPRTNVVSSILEFPPIDTDGMIRNLRLKSLAKENAERELPQSEGEALDSVEQNIINEIETEGKIQFNSYLEHQKTYAERAGDATVRALVLRLSATVGNAVTNFERNTHAGTDELYARKRAVIESERELNNFKKLQGLSRPPRIGLNLQSEVHPWLCLVDRGAYTVNEAKISTH